ncbi:imidazole glycerol phosphate synthase subunit HisH, partial [Candidatus Dojkabacteria bacterium]|nr:imidazole glycerol phosphate synthase subunit HisH [Candidatus Dojkabacteria bacterium]
MKQIGIIDYKAGNIRSAVNAIQKVMRDNKLAYEVTVSSNTKELEKANLLIFPGQGAARQAIGSLKDLQLDKVIKNSIGGNKPFLGICIGMQVLFDYSEEQDTQCLGIIPGKVVKFPKDLELPIPNIGWRLVGEDYFYHTHSYYPVPRDKNIVKGTTTYGVEFASVIKTGNILATQFHPEKSGMAGLNFI